MTVEDRLRATTEAVSASMRPVRPLDLSSAAPAPARPSRVRAAARPVLYPVRRTPGAVRRVLHSVRRPRGAGRRLDGRRLDGRRPSGWLVPLAAAAAVVVLAAALVTVRTLAGAPGGASPARPGPATPSALAGVPKYYAMLTSAASAASAAVTLTETATGKALFTLKATPGNAKPGEYLQFDSASAAADGLTFALSVSPYGTSATAKTPSVVGWDVLRGNPDGTSWNLVRSFVPALPLGAQLAASALSPDGTELAVLSYVQPAHLADDTQASLRIYSVASGHVLRAYSATGTHLEIGGSPLANPYPGITWLANGDGLNFAWASVKGDMKPDQPANFIQQVRHLDLAKPGGNLLAISTLVTSVSSATEICGLLTPTADGRGALCATQNVTSEPTPGASTPVTCHAAPPPLAFRYYYGLRGAYRVLYAQPPSAPVDGNCWYGSTAILWASPSGATLIGTISQVRQPRLLNGPTAIGVVSHGQWTKLPAYRSSVGAF